MSNKENSNNLGHPLSRFKNVGLHRQQSQSNINYLESVMNSTVIGGQNSNETTVTFPNHFTKTPNSAVGLNPFNDVKHLVSRVQLSTNKYLSSVVLDESSTNRFTLEKEVTTREMLDLHRTYETLKSDCDALEAEELLVDETLALAECIGTFVSWFDAAQESLASFEANYQKLIDTAERVKAFLDVKCIETQTQSESESESESETKAKANFVGTLSAELARICALLNNVNQQLSSSSRQQEKQAQEVMIDYKLIDEINAQYAEFKDNILTLNMLKVTKGL
jgi:hypothetical protein